MYQRISSWSGLGFVFSLKSFFWSFFERQIKRHDFSKDSELARRDVADKALADYMVNNPDVVDGLEGAFSETPFLEEHRGFRALMTTAKSAEEPLYTKETAPQFHRLLLATLILFGVFLNGVFSKLYISEDAETAFMLIKEITKLLYLILRSSAFKHHIRIITNNGYDMNLLTHYDEKEDIYLTFAYDNMIRRRPDNSDNHVSYDSLNDDPGLATLKELASVCKSD
jgi:hypothetical protein